ncbi:MAG: hypothetical protein GY953_47325, partial [bacterium]|nr:hypothetical protein [bacterium]
ELRERIWAGDTFVDFDHALTTAVKKLRRTLNDSATEPRYIETLPKRGYRFIAPVSTGPATAEQAPSDGDSRPRLRLQRNLLLAVVLLSLVALAAVWLREPVEAPQPGVRRFSITTSGMDATARTRAAVSPNGRHIAFVAGEDRRLWIRDLDREQPRQLDQTAGAAVPFWSGDSEFVIFAASGELKKISVRGGAPLTICELPGSASADGTWNPNHDTVVFSAGLPPVLHQVAADGGVAEPLLDPVITERGGSNYHPAFLPPRIRRDTLLLTAGSPAYREIFAVDLASGLRRRVIRGLHPAYSPTGHVVYQAPVPGGGIWAVPFSVETLEPTGQPFPISEVGCEPGLADDGTLVYVDCAAGGGYQRLVLKDRSGKKLHNIGQPQDRIRSPRLSPDGRRVAVCGIEAGEYDIWLHSAEDGTKSRVSFDPVVEAEPVWSPTGDELVYRIDRDAQTAIFRQRLDRTSPPESMIMSPATKHPSHWSADGRHLVFLQNDAQGRSDLWRLSATPDGGYRAGPLWETPFSEGAAQLSPDGKWLAFCSDETGRYEVFVAAFPTGGESWQVSTDGGCQPRWRPDGAELFYVSRDALHAVEVITSPAFSYSPPVLLFRDPALERNAPYRTNYDVAPGGQQFVLVETVEPPESPPQAIHVVEDWFAALR